MPTRDRLAELRSVAGNGVYQDTVEVAMVPDDRPKQLDEVFREVERMRDWIHDIDANTQLMRRLHADPTYHTNKHLQDQLDSAATKSHATGLKLCGALRQFGERVRAGGVGGVGGRIARLQYAATRRLADDALARHEAFLRAYRDDQRAILHDQIRLTNLTITDEECESLLESNNISIFVDNLQAETQEARRALRDVEARHAELVRVEASLKEVRDLFLQLAHLVSEQQEQVDTVEYYASTAGEHVESGGRLLLKGTVARTKARKKKVGLILCLVGGFLIVLVVLILT